jgi:8-oxo-dGTP pyrophosphatase MutT (NUDIX family)
MALIEYAAAGGVIIRDGRMLLLERPTRNEIRLPKGHIEPGEIPETTALRETTEETGYNELNIVATLGCHLVEFDYQEDHYRRTEYYFLMHITGDLQAARPAKDEAEFRVFWAPLTQAAKLLTYASEQYMAQQAIIAEQNFKIQEQ